MCSRLTHGSMFRNLSWWLGYHIECQGLNLGWTIQVPYPLYIFLASKEFFLHLVANLTMVQFLALYIVPEELLCNGFKTQNLKWFNKSEYLLHFTKLFFCIYWSDYLMYVFYLLICHFKLWFVINLILLIPLIHLE